MEVLGMLAAAIWWFIKALAMIVLLGVALGVVLLVLIVAREVAWVIRQGNKEKMGMEEDEEREREKRINALERLAKKDFVWLMREVGNLIFKYLDICGAWQAVKGTIDELDSRQAFIKDKDGLKEPKAAYL